MKIWRDITQPPSSDYLWYRLNKEKEFVGYFVYKGSKWVFVNKKELKGFKIEENNKEIINSIVDGAPAAYDTLKEIADKIGTLDGQNGQKVYNTATSDIQNPQEGDITIIPNNGGIKEYKNGQWINRNESEDIFWATYGTTTFSEIEEAVVANKIVMLKYIDNSTTRILRLQSYSKFSGYGFATFIESDSTANICITLSKDWNGETWQEIQEFEQELQTNKTKHVYMPLDEDEGYRMYPSLLAVYNFIREHLSQIEGIVFAPTIIPSDGLESGTSGRILIQCVNPNAEIYYRLNQTGDFQLYTGGYININQDTIVETYAMLHGDTSTTVTKTFYVYQS